MKKMRQLFQPVDSTWNDEGTIFPTICGPNPNCNDMIAALSQIII